MDKKLVKYGQSDKTITLKITEWEQIQTIIQDNKNRGWHYGNQKQYNKRQNNILNALDKVSRYCEDGDDY